MNLHSYIASSQSSTKPSSITSKTNKPSKHSNKENINFLNFSKLAINSSKSQDRFNTIDFIPNSILLNKYEQNKFQTEANSSLTYKTITNASHSRYKSIANMPYKIPIHETNFKRLPVKNEQKRQNNNNDNNKILGNFQKSFQSQNYSISLQQKQGDLVEIPEISSPEKEDNIKFIENEENYNGFLLLKNFGVLPQKNPAIIRKESFLSSFSNYENKSIMSFPDEITNSTHKNLLLFKKIQNTPKLLSNLLKKNKNIINNSFYHDKILKCGEKIEQSPNPMTKILDKTVLSTDSFEDSNVNNSVYKFLLCREKAYQLNPHSLRTQKEINPMMRSVLIDWMSEVSTEFGLKRQTLHQAIYYLDKCLETNKTLKKNTFQLVGVASLLIASKIEEVQSPNILEFRKACDDGYSIPDIQAMELTIIKDLKWLLHPPTLQNWTDIYLSQWDFFLETQQPNDEIFFFRKADEQSYIHYRDFSQLIDMVMLDFEYLQYKPRVLIASLMFLLLGYYYKIFNKKEIVEEFQNSSKFLFNFTQFNHLFSEFLENYFGFTLYELLPTIQYLSGFFAMEFLYELPAAEHILEENNLFEGYYEEFLSYHVRNQKNLEFIKSKLNMKNFGVKF